MSTQLPPPAEIADHYNTLLKGLKGEYIHSRWGDSEIKRRHYRQTEMAIRHALAGVPRVGDVLEIGCGPAVWTPLFIIGASTVHLFDISEEMLSQAKKNLQGFEGGRHEPKVTYTCGDFVDSALPAASFDTIVSARAFEYMSDKEAFVRKCAALLRPGGTLIVITKNRAWRDLMQTAKSLAGVDRKEIPTGIAMQLDLVSWQQVVEMYRGQGLQSVGAFPVVLGSYHRPYTWRLGLAFADWLHRRVFRQEMTTVSARTESLAESYLVIGRKPA